MRGGGDRIFSPAMTIRRVPLDALRAAIMSDMPFGIGFAVDRYIGFPTVSGDFDTDFILFHSCVELLITRWLN